jgi:hypothetical protein
MQVAKNTWEHAMTSASGATDAWVGQEAVVPRGKAFAIRDLERRCFRWLGG